MDFFNNWQSFELDGATIKFYKTQTDGINYIGFDSRACVPPEPMVNAMLALNLVKDQNTKVVMINHKFPAGLIPKIEPNFNIERENLDGEQVKLTFSLKDNANPVNLDTKNTCHG
ncbi:hypothetical protein CR66_01450 [Campylobacter mucosalis]|uniref:hypothetical protein n=1 Tax=Campylobacter mucosalis TaxID=202 RepID=UPI0004D9AFCA|nr:hypothetical protein [Campylobacter mucosalis]KEA46538.1 hypothetical protein CR66_01450 [Campylobacter mucosalis]QKF62962.1 hypothetical protein CMCT_0823 [Campylobacter mucosalis]